MHRSPHFLPSACVSVPVGGMHNAHVQGIEILVHTRKLCHFASVFEFEHKCTQVRISYRPAT